ncbi:MAG: polyamine aminopropyltransferase [Syntrophothermus sp.]|uniref:polyamine aminopropyltransferase n=1 Tax=Syntrophothermus sp. TaxID=2736299 RepID=UPI00257B2891|nr:polyamine aminopropyltransferase [Syntrophothermus sp.]NSW83399.1 polyamine aminopropyltransferase [Syntrophothermus sp.]
MDAWLHEGHTKGYTVSWRLRDVIHVEKTPYQELAIVDTYEWGKALVLDGCIQTTEVDEFIYHEMITHVAMMAHPEPKRVLIIGGGDGGVLREVLRYDSVVAADLVEIDARVVENCQIYLPEIACGFSDSRANIIIEDGLQYVKKPERKYDVVIVDSSDPVGPAVELFGAAFYQDVCAIMEEDGIMVAQAESPLFFRDTFVQVFLNMRQVFPIARVYLTSVPTYVSGYWAFGVGSKKYRPEEVAEGRRTVGGLKWYTPDLHRAAFVLPRSVKESLETAAEAR